jgi:hypothetical protein
VIGQAMPPDALQNVACGILKVESMCVPVLKVYDFVSRRITQQSNAWPCPRKRFIHHVLRNPERKVVHRGRTIGFRIDELEARNSGQNSECPFPDVRALRRRQQWEAEIAGVKVLEFRDFSRPKPHAFDAMLLNPHQPSTVPE